MLGRAQALVLVALLRGILCARGLPLFRRFCPEDAARVRWALRPGFWPRLRCGALWRSVRGWVGKAMLLSVRVRRGAPLAVRSGLKLSGSPLKP